ncbi:amino acid ABC transporter permease [Micrococcaceae bacterium Sec6.3]
MPSTTVFSTPSKDRHRLAFRTPFSALQVTDLNSQKPRQRAARPRQRLARTPTEASGEPLFYTVTSFVVGLLGGIVLALMRLSSFGPYRWLATAYVEFFRGVPALLVFLAFGYGVPFAFGVSWPIPVVVMAALGMVSAAYIAETLRAGLQAVPRGQMEAARSLGMPAWRAMVTIVIPQAFRIVLPPLTNEVILLTKDSSLVYVLGLAAHEYELTKFGRDGISALDAGMTPILVAGLFYLVITVPLSLLARRFETRSTKKGH